MIAQFSGIIANTINRYIRFWIACEIKIWSPHPIRLRYVYCWVLRNDHKYERHYLAYRRCSSIELRLHHAGTVLYSVAPVCGLLPHPHVIMSVIEQIQGNTACVLHAQGEGSNKIINCWGWSTCRAVLNLKNTFVLNKCVYIYVLIPKMFSVNNLGFF